MTRMNVEIPHYIDVVFWLKRHGAESENKAYPIAKIGNRSPLIYFLAWVENNSIKLKPHPRDRVQEGYTLQRSEWDSFILFRKGLTALERTKAATYATRYREWGCTNVRYYPSVAAISWQYFNEAEK